MELNIEEASCVLTDPPSHVRMTSITPPRDTNGLVHPVSWREKRNTLHDSLPIPIACAISLDHNRVCLYKVLFSSGVRNCVLVYAIAYIDCFIFMFFCTTVCLYVVYSLYFSDNVFCNQNMFPKTPAALLPSSTAALMSASVGRFSIDCRTCRYRTREYWWWKEVAWSDIYDRDSWKREGYVLRTPNNVLEVVWFFFYEPLVLTFCRNQNSTPKSGRPIRDSQTNLPKTIQGAGMDETQIRVTIRVSPSMKPEESKRPYHIRVFYFLHLLQERNLYYVYNLLDRSTAVLPLQ